MQLTTREVDRRSQGKENTRTPGLERNPADSKDERDPKEQQPTNLREKGL